MEYQKHHRSKKKLPLRFCKLKTLYLLKKIRLFIIILCVIVTPIYYFSLNTINREYLMLIPLCLTVYAVSFVITIVAAAIEIVLLKSIAKDAKLRS